MIVHIENLPERKISVRLEDTFRSNLFTTCKEQFGSYRALNMYLSKLIKKRLWKGSVLLWYKGKSGIPLFILKVLLKTYNSSLPNKVSLIDIEVKYIPFLLEQT